MNMKKSMIAVSAALLMSATSAQAAGNDFMKDVTYGAGIGTVDLGGLSSSALLFYGIAEKPVKVKALEAKDFNSTAQLRLGTSTTASDSTASIFGTVKNESTLDYLISGIFKASKEIDTQLSAYGMLGFSYAKATSTVSLGGTSASASSTDTSLSWGLGLDYEVDRELTVGVEYAAYFSDVKAFAINAKYDF